MSDATEPQRHVRRPTCPTLQTIMWKEDQNGSNSRTRGRGDCPGGRGCRALGMAAVIMDTAFCVPPWAGWLIAVGWAFAVALWFVAAALVRWYLCNRFRR